MEAGDHLALVVGAKDGNHFCDTTVIELAIAEVGGQERLWSLAKDVLDSIHAGNPHADSLGHADVWHFYAVNAAQTSSQPAASEPPFSLASNARTAKESVKELSAKRPPDDSAASASIPNKPGRERSPRCIQARRSHRTPKPELGSAMQVEVPANGSPPSGSWVPGTSCGDPSRARMGNGASTTIPLAFSRPRPT